MSSRRVSGINAVVGVAILIPSIHVSALIAGDSSAASNASAAQSQTQPRDPKLNVPARASSREQALQAATSADPTSVPNWLELARLQEERRAIDAAEHTFKAALKGTSGAREVLLSMTAFYNRTNQFDKAMAAFEDAAARNPHDPQGHQLVAVNYFDKVNKDLSLTPEKRLTYTDAGIAATDRALAAKDDDADALVYKNLLLRFKATLDADPVRQQQLIKEADGLRSRAMELNNLRNGHLDVDGQQPVRVGGNVAAPTKTHDVRPVYPKEAQDALVAGMVILETVIDTQGHVRSARVLRSIPALDQAAVDAVKQWRFTPTLLNGMPVPVIMTVTVNFTLQ
jgi:TonB family protein